MISLCISTQKIFFYFCSCPIEEGRKSSLRGAGSQTRAVTTGATVIRDGTESCSEHISVSAEWAVNIGVLWWPSTAREGPFLPALPPPCIFGCPCHRLQKALRVLRKYLLLKFRFGKKSFRFHCSVALSEQASQAAAQSVFRQGLFNVLEPGQSEYLYPAGPLAELHRDHVGQKSLFTSNHDALHASLTVPWMTSVEHSLFSPLLLLLENIPLSSCDHVSVLSYHWLNCLGFMLSSL